ncbi:methyl jasmonate esterase 1-like [Andrographis paniculata]|uniref:methyl jasmonate esterase 1-like n=1 Tax=Andrographis paniculata TaxID=175694 RepID=UPI0021E7D0A8|nr:methyl jasmonate esterase 1-like [Andrographis paniculata]
MEHSGKDHHHFVLVHGSGHGAWCWYKVATALRSDGHRVTALDMAASGANPNRLEELSSLSDYSQPLIEFMASLPSDERVVLVGHSMGGCGVCLAVEAFPEKVAVAVFAAAFMAGPDASADVVYAEIHKHVDSYMDCKFFFDNGDDKPPTSLLLGPNFLSSRMYQMSPPQDLTLATMLVRPIGFLEQMKKLELDLSEEKFGSVRRAYVGCEMDTFIKQDVLEWLIQKTPVDEVKIITGADHMVMLSKPLEFCSCLKDLADKFKN